MTQFAETMTKNDFYVPTLVVLNKLGGSGSNREIEAELVGALDLSEADMSVVHAKSGTPVLTNKMAWARSYLKEAGLTDSGGHGIWVLTEDGRRSLPEGREHIERLVADAMVLYYARRREQAAAAEAEQTLAEPQLEADGSATDFSDADPGEEIDDSWQARLLSTLKTLDPAAFERLAQRLLRESGFTRVNVTGKSGDGGIDGNGVLRLNLLSFQVSFQCKRYTGSVGPGTIRDFRGAMMGRADKGLVITTGTFTQEAQREATRDGALTIDLIDGDALVDLLRDRRLGVRVEVISTERVTLDDRFFAEI